MALLGNKKRRLCNNEKKSIYSGFADSDGFAEHPAFAAEYEATAYDVSIADELKVPFADSKEGYFEGGLVTGFGSAVTFQRL